MRQEFVELANDAAEKGEVLKDPRFLDDGTELRMSANGKRRCGKDGAEWKEPMKKRKNQASEAMKAQASEPMKAKLSEAMKAKPSEAKKAQASEAKKAEASEAMKAEASPMKAKASPEKRTEAEKWFFGEKEEPEVVDEEDEDPDMSQGTDFLTASFIK